MMAMITDTHKLIVSESIRRDILSYLRANDMQFNSIWEKEQTDAFQLVKNRPHKRVNVIQRKRGYKSTSHAKGDIQYSTCVTNNINLICAELVDETIVFDSKVEINTLKKVLKEHGMKLKANIVMRNTNVPARKEDMDDKKFKPPSRNRENPTLLIFLVLNNP